MPNHEEYIRNFDAAVALLKGTRRELDKIADNLLASETVRAHAEVVASGITENLGLLATERAAYQARHDSGVAGPSETAVARSFDIAADLSKVIAAANRPAKILASLTRLLDGLNALGAPATEAVGTPAPAAAAGEVQLAAFAPKVAAAKGPVTTFSKGVQVADRKPDFQVKASDLDVVPAGPAANAAGVAQSSKGGADKPQVAVKE
jgi:hypothetical protein